MRPKSLLKGIFFFFLCIMIVGLSLFPRSVEVLNNNPLFGFDNGRDYLAVKNIVVNHKPTLIGAEVGAGSAGIGYLFQGPGYFYFLAIPFILFHGNPVGAVWLMLFFGLLTIGFAFYFGTKLWGKKGGFLLAFLFTVSPHLIAQSRFFWNPNMPTFFILVAFYFYYVFIKTKKLFYLFLTAFFSGFVYNFELAIAIPLCIAITINALFICKKIKALGVLFLGFLLAFSPMILFDARHHFVGFKNFFFYLFIHKGTDVTPTFIRMHGHDVWQTILFNFAETFPKNGIFPAIFLFLLFGVLLYFALKNDKNKNLKFLFYYFLSLIPINIYVFDSLLNNAYSYYFTDLNLVYSFIFCYLLISFWQQKKIFIFIPLSLFLTVLILFGIQNSIQNSIADYKDYGGTAKLKGKIDAIDFIYHDAQNKPFNLLVFTPPIYTYAYDYLIWWHGEKTYGYVPGTEKKGTFYLLIEKDGGKPWTYKGWEETVIKSGKVVFTKTLPSGFIVEKRIAD